MKSKLIFGVIHFISFFLFLNFSFAQDAHVVEGTHVVAKGETLGTILQAHNISPLWGPKGNVKKTIELNKGLISATGDLPEVGTVIKLPTSIGISAEQVQLEKIVTEKNKANQSMNVSDDLLEEKVAVELPLILAPEPDVIYVPEKHISYRIKTGDTIGTILQKFNITPLWGPGGHVKKVTEMNQSNPGFKITDLKKGSKILLPIPNKSSWDDELEMFVYEKLEIKVREPVGGKSFEIKPQKTIIINEINVIGEPKKENQMVASAPMILAPEPDFMFVPEKYISYRIKTGDTIGTILQKFNITPLWGPGGHVKKVTEMNQLNPGFKITDLKKGSKILLPIPNRSYWDEELEMFVYERAAKSEKVEEIEKTEVQKTEIEKLIEVQKPIETRDDLFEKEVVSGLPLILAPEPDVVYVPEKHVSYRIKTGDTIGTILQKFNITPLWGPGGHVKKVTEMNQLNPGFKITDLKKGTKILLPIPNKSSWDDELEMFVYERVVKIEKVERTGELSKETVPTREVAQEIKNIEKPEEDILPEEVITKDEVQKIETEAFYLTRERDYGPLKLRPGEEDTGIRKGNKTYFWYKVKRGETISEILHATKVKPLWGKIGYVNLTIRINDGKVKKNGDQVAEKEWIRVPIPEGTWEEPVQMTGAAEPEVQSIDDDIPQIPPLPQPVVVKAEQRKPAETPLVCESNQESNRIPSWLAPDIIRRLEDYERLKRLPQAYEEHMNPSEKKYGALKLNGQMRFTKIQATQKLDLAEVSLSSIVDTEGGLEWTKNVNEKWDVSLGYQYRKLMFKSPQDRPLISDEKTYQSGYLGGAYHFTPNLQTGFFLGYQEKPYLHSITDIDVTIVSVSEPYLGSSLRYDLFFHGPLYISIEGGGKISLGGSGGDGVSSDVGYSAYGLLEQRILLSNNHAVGFSLNSEFGSGSTNLSEQTDSSFGINLFWIWTP